jgi:type IV pilus assembly protein PilV
MTSLPLSPVRRQRGTTLIEVLVTLVILAFGLLGIAAFQAKAQVGSLEAYQRAQAVVLLEDMQARIVGNAAGAADYAASGTLGTGDVPGDCTLLAVGAARDRCEWSTALLGAAEKKGEDSTGSMIGARGCITQLVAPDDSVGVCRQGVYLVTVAWQGMHATKTPSLTCGSGEYGAESQRRAIAVRVAVGLPECL